MNQTSNSTNIERIRKIQNELAQLKEKQKIGLQDQPLKKQGDQYWQLDAKIKAQEIVLNHLISICIFCRQDCADLDVKTGQKAHRDCFKKYWGL